MNESGVFMVLVMFHKSMVSCSFTRNMSKDTTAEHENKGNLSNAKMNQSKPVVTTAFSLLHFLTFDSEAAVSFFKGLQ